MADENGCSAHRKRKISPIAKAVGKKQKGPHGPVIGGHIQNAPGVCFGAIDHVAVMVDGTHQFFRVAAAVQPKGGVIAGGCSRRKIGWRLFKEFIEGQMMVILITADHYLY